MHRAEDRVVPHFTVVGAVDTPAAVEHCLSRLMSLDGVVWSTVVTAASRVLAVAGERHERERLAEVGNRMLAILRSFEDQQAGGLVRLVFEQGTVVGASLGRHAVVAGVSTASDEDLLPVVDEVRAILAPHDLASAEPAPETGSAEDARPDEHVGTGPVAPPPLVGARFAGAGERTPRASRRRRFGSR